MIKRHGLSQFFAAACITISLPFSVVNSTGATDRSHGFETILAIKACLTPPFAAWTAASSLRQSSISDGTKQKTLQALITELSQEITVAYRSHSVRFSLAHRLRPGTVPVISDRSPPHHAFPA